MNVGSAALWRASWQARRRLAASLLFGLVAALVWHFGREDPPVDLSSLAFWLHWTVEGMVALGLAAAVFIVSGATRRFLEAERRLRARSATDATEYD